MKLALISDLHANREAVEAVMAHARERGVEHCAFLGDFVGYGADPDACFDLARENTDLCLAGNHDLAGEQRGKHRAQGCQRVSGGYCSGHAGR